MTDRHAGAGRPDPWNDPSVDPRRIVTPDAFQVAPELLGRPLAGPWRRLGAMLVDLFLLALLTNAGGVFLALAAAIALLRATTTRQASLLKRGVLISLRVVGALILFVTVLQLWDGARDLLRDETPAERVAEDAGPQMELGALGGLGLTRDFIRLARARSPEQARPAAERVVDQLMAAESVSRSDLQTALDQLAAGGDLPDAAAVAVRDALARRLAEAERPPAADSAPEETPTDALVRRYADALAASDSAALTALEPRVVARIAGDTLARLERRYERARDRLRQTEDELDAAEDELERESNLGQLLLIAADEAGLGLGWSWLYFTVFLVLWNGQTPGKRMLGIRVIRLDGKPLGWWAALERFGGYFAALLTGLLGFAQILWDRNRQGVHDKISETVVLRVREKRPELKGQA